jgi:hypothetical protein
MQTRFETVYFMKRAGVPDTWECRSIQGNQYIGKFKKMESGLYVWKDGGLIADMPKINQNEIYKFEDLLDQGVQE